LRELAKDQRLALGGVAARDGRAEVDGILHLSGDLVAEAARINELLPRREPSSHRQP